MILTLRTILLKNRKKTEVKKYQPIKDANYIAESLSLAVQCKTVSLQHPDTDDGSEFLKFHSFLENRYPYTHKVAEKIVINKYSLIYKIHGTDNTLAPCCFLAHQDVVPATPEGWEVDPFAGTIKDGFVYGRGSMDMKCQFIALFEAVEDMLKSGIKFKRTIYMCFGHDEEYTTEEGALKICQYLKAQNVKFEYLVDEGGLILDGSILGIKGTLALIGTAEKGQSNFKVTASFHGGHASMPDKTNAVHIIAEGIEKLKKKPLKPKWTPPVLQLIDTIAPYMKGIFRFFFINRFVFGGLLKTLFSKVSTITNSVVSTTITPTMLEASSAPNVISPTASCIINCRLLPGHTTEMVRNHIQKCFGDKCKTEIVSASEATQVAPIDSYAYKQLTNAILESYEDLIPAPFLFTAGTDAKYYYPVCDNIFRFTPFIYEEQDRTRIHALNERTSVESLPKAHLFYTRLIQNTCVDMIEIK